MKEAFKGFVLHPLFALDEFTAYLGAERGLSKNTLEGYTRDIRACLAKYKKLALSSNEVVAYLGFLRGNGASSASVYRALIALKVFYRFLRKEGFVEENPTIHLETPKLWNIIPDILHKEELSKLFDAPDEDEIIGLRDKVCMLLLYATGIRVSELCSLKREQIREEGIRVVGKGNKVRVVPVAKDAVDKAMEYIQASGKEVGPFLLSKRGYPLDRHQIWRRIAGYAKALGLEKRVSPHSFRHTYATHLLDNGADLRVIQEFLGHAEISTTERYTHLSRKHVTEAFNRFHPKQ